MQIGNQPSPFTTPVVGIDYPHAEIHTGSHYFYADCVELDNGVSQDYLFTTGSKYPHMSFEYSGSAITQLQVFEASDKTGTTLQTLLNNNRASSKTTTATLHKAVTGGTTDGTLIWCDKSGSATNQAQGGASSSQDSELILKLNTKYIFRITSFTNDNLTNLKIGYYDESVNYGL